MLALKFASLARGASGVRWPTVALIGAMLDMGLTPVIPAQGSVGASGDLAPLAHMAAAMIGVGEIHDGEKPVAAAAALKRANLKPIVLGPKEGLALLNGTQFSTAYARWRPSSRPSASGRRALVTGALSTEAARGSDTPFDPRIHALRPHAGQVETAAALRALMAGSAIRASHRKGDPRVQDPYCLRCQPQVMGAAIDLLRAAAATLAIEANAVTDNPLIFAGADEALSGGNFHAEPVAFAADMIALALCEIGSLAERRIAMLVDPGLSGLPAFLTPHPGLNSGFMIAQGHRCGAGVGKQAASLARQRRFHPHLRQPRRDHVSMAAHSARRLTEMVDNLRSIIAIELIVAAQGCDFHRPLASSAALESVRAALRLEVPALEEDRLLHPDIAAAIDFVRDGKLLDAVDRIDLPTICGAL